MDELPEFEITNLALLKLWVSEEQPELLEELNAMTFNEVRVTLNRITNLNVHSNVTVEEGARIYLTKLKEIYGG